MSILKNYILRRWSNHHWTFLKKLKGLLIVINIQTPNVYKKLRKKMPFRTTKPWHANDTRLLSIILPFFCSKKGSFYNLLKKVRPYILFHAAFEIAVGMNSQCYLLCSVLKIWDWIWRTFFSPLSPSDFWNFLMIKKMKKMYFLQKFFFEFIDFKKDVEGFGDCKRVLFLLFNFELEITTMYRGHQFECYVWP